MGKPSAAQKKAPTKRSSNSKTNSKSNGRRSNTKSKSGPSKTPIKKTKTSRGKGNGKGKVKVQKVFQKPIPKLKICMDKSKFFDFKKPTGSHIFEKRFDPTKTSIITLQSLIFKKVKTKEEKLNNLTNTAIACFLTDVVSQIKDFVCDSDKEKALNMITSTQHFNVNC